MFLKSKVNFNKPITVWDESNQNLKGHEYQIDNKLYVPHMNILIK